MADLIDRQAAINAITNLLSPGEIGSGDIITLTRMAEMWECTDELGKLPAIDAVEVVRCKDCCRAKEDKLYGGLWCGGHIRHEQWFCADGKRRDDETD